MLEIVKSGTSAARARVAILDFDGTLSLIRSGWMQVMIPMCIEFLAETNSGESDDQLRAVAEDFIWRLTGKETIYQMMALGDAVLARGGTPREPLAYKRIYLDRLSMRISGRIRDLESGAAAPERYLVPGSRALLEALNERGLTLFLASGTDDADVKREAGLLDVSRYFDGRVYGAQDDLKSFSKGLLVRKLVDEAGHSGDELLVFGDGYVEIEEVKKAGGTAVGVASAEPECREVDEWKRQRLIRVGADFIIPNFEDLGAILSTVLVESQVAG